MFRERQSERTTVILHSQADDVVPFADSEQLVRNSGQPASALIVVGKDHRLADQEPLAKMSIAVDYVSNGDHRAAPGVF